jgi:prepilin-type N-terminal cleavage/methylation domain-containing protein
MLLETFQYKMDYMNKNKLTTKSFRLKNIFSKKSEVLQNQGFTLIEIMVSVSIFTIIMTVGMGSLVSIVRNYEVSQQQKKVHDGLNYALESMAREIRLGKNYAAGAVSVNEPADDGTDDSLGFLTADNRGYVIYYVDNGSLFVYRDGATNAVDGTYALTDDSQIIIQEVRFTVIGTETLTNGNYQQPLVWIQIKARPQNSDRETVVQTLVSQRTLDV